MDIKTRFKVLDEVVFLIEKKEEYDKELRGGMRLVIGTVESFTVYGNQYANNVTYEIRPTNPSLKNYLVREENIAENVGELLQMILDQAPKNVRIKLNDIKND